ncbi:MAG TPA: hypothetical protein VGI10_29125 [Polyangiaceae bacterium]|jgi:hypothetical protein
MRARVVTALLLAGLGGCSSKACEPTPPSIPSGCWSHPLASGDDPSCSSGSETEPNGDLVAANRVGDGSCSWQYFTGSVAADVDVFRADGAFCKATPTLQASLSTDQDDVRLCLFATCATGKTGLAHCSGTTSPSGQTAVANHMPEGILGCCRAGAGTLSVDVNCDSQYAPLGKPPEWHSYLVVDRVRDTGCTPYKIGYQF